MRAAVHRAGVRPAADRVRCVAGARAGRPAAAGPARAGRRVTGALLLAHNRLTNGDPFLFGYVAKYGPGHEIGFGHSGWGAAHTPLRGLLNVGHDLNLFNRFVLEWPAPALLLVMLPFLRGTADRRDWLLLASFLALPAAYFFYWSHGLAFGPRFLYEALGPVLVLVARGLAPFELRAAGRNTVRFDWAARFVPVALVFALLAGLPPLWRWYRGYWGVDGRLLAEARARRLDNALVFCAELGDAFNANSLALDGPVVYARDLGPLNPALTLAYPGRDCFIARKDELVRADGKIGKRNPMWKGDSVKYNALHDWVKWHKTKSKLCENCNKIPPFDLSNISQKYKRDLSDWEWLCRRCHMKKDGRIIKLINYDKRPRKTR